VLDCGPRNSFTCEGLLVHNSGNLQRFMDDFVDVFFNGLQSLDMGEKLDGTVRKDEDDRPVMKCPKCGFSPFGKKCIACGHEKAVPALVESKPGEMREVMIGGKRAAENHHDLWAQVCTYTKDHGNPDTAYGRAFHIFKDITGQDPNKRWSHGSTPRVPITQPVLNKIRSRVIAWTKRRTA
jgi:DNA repair protein RadD